MSRTSRAIIGSKGFNSRVSKFLMEPQENQILENLLVTTGTRKRRQNYKRWLYDKYCSNAGRFIGTYKKSFLLIKDCNNLKYNCFGAGQSSTIEIRFRLPGVGGYSLKGTMYVASRQIHGTGYTFQLNLINTGAVAFDEYKVQLILSDGTGTTTLDFANTKVKHGVWYTLSILRDNANTRFRSLLDGVFVENIAFGATHTGAQGTFNTTQTNNTFSDIVLAAKNDLTDFTPIDIDEFRLWNEARSDANVLAYYNKEVPVSARTNMICYYNFQDNHDGNISADKINSNCPVFFGGGLPFKDSNDYLVFDGSSMVGQLDPIGSVLTIPFNVWGYFNGGEIIAINEVAFKVLKVKQCRIIGGLEMYYDAGPQKYGFRFHYTNNGLATTIDSGGLVALADIDVTEYYVAIREVYSGTPHLELWVNGVLKSSVNHVGVHGAGSGAGKYIAATTTGNDEFAAIRLKWFRTFDSEEPDDTYFSQKYNQEVSDFKLVEYSHGVQSMTWVSNVQGTDMRSITGVGTSLNSKFVSGAPAFDRKYFSLKEDKETVGENYQDQIQNLNTGTQNWKGQYAETTVDPWSNAGYPKINNKEGFLVTALLTRYNVDSWKNIKFDKDTGEKEAFTTSKITGTKDRDTDPGNKLKLYYYVAGALQSREAKPSFIGGVTRIDSLKPCRYLGGYKNLDGSIDVIISIVGTAFNVFNRATKALTQYNVSILPNGNKPFTGDFLNGELYLTDGMTKIHVYTYRKQLRVVKWGFDFTHTRPTLSQYIAGGPWTVKAQYAYCYYNRELDQFGQLCIPTSAGAETEISIAAQRAIQLDSIIPSRDFYDGVSDIAIFRTKDLNGGGAGIQGHLWLYDFIMGNSQGAMDWSQTDTRLSQRYPIEIASATSDMSPPNGEFLVAHNKRIWVPDNDLIRFSRIGSELHTGVIKSETYLYPSDHAITIQGNRKVTGAISFYDKILFVFTNSTMDLITGNDQSDFEIRRIHEGIGCISHRTLHKYGDAIIWGGLDDIYILKQGVPTPIDGEGKISKYFKENLDRTRLAESFAILNRDKNLYEFHAYDHDGFKITIVYDLKSDNFSFNKDVRATYGTEISDDYNKPVVFYGTNEGFIVNEDTSGGTYQPTTGSTKTTVTNFSGSTVTVAASDLQTTEGGLIGNTVYIVSQQAANKGAVVKAVIESNTATTITVDGNTAEYILGTTFVPVSGDIVYIGPIFTRWKSPVIFVTSVQDSTNNIEMIISDVNASELVDLCFVHNRGNALGNAYFGLYLDGSTTLSKVMQIDDLDKDYSRIEIPDSSRGKFFEIESYHLHESAEYELIGFIMGMSISRGDYAGTP